MARDEDHLPTEGWFEESGERPVSEEDLTEEEPAELLEAGTMVDHFRVVRLVGKGGMGEVYLARDTLLGRKVALKIVQPSRMGPRHAADRFLQEARTTAKFSHPHIVGIYAVGTYDGRPYVALEYLEGQTLRQRAEQDPPSPREVLRFGHAIAAALAEAHRGGVLHRDLKPENVVIGRDGRLRVVDFGLAKLLPASDRDSNPAGPGEPDPIADEAPPLQSDGRHVAGTPAYMAPEQWDGNDADESTDIWALGTILYELVTGHRPYHEIEHSMVMLSLRVASNDPVPTVVDLREIPAELAELILRCLSKQPDLRPRASEVAATLEQLLYAGRDRIADEENPFRGLSPFTERHAGFFFGRQAEIEAFLERLRDEPVLPVVGPSGAGKSSFVQAGVIPRLREQAAWTVLTVRPGDDPFLGLASRLIAGESTTRGRSTTFRAVVSEKPQELNPALSKIITREGLRPGAASGRATVSDDSGRGPAPSDPDLPPVTSAPPDALEAPRDDVGLARTLAESPTRLGLLLTQLAERERSRVLLCVDQLEELYTLTDDEETRRGFMRAICTAADDPLAPVRVIFTLRDDFLGRLAEGPAAREALSHVTVLRSPGPEDLAEILSRPLEVLGYRYDDPSLVQEMVAAVRGEPASLPLLQFALRTLWERRDRSRQQLSRKTYEAMGGVEGALADHADGVLAGMTPAQVRVAREVLLRLVTPEGTRRVLAVARATEELGTQADEVLARLTQSRLVSVRKGYGKTGPEAMLELAHESLVRNWARLAQWIDESREELTFLAQVEQAAELWERRGRREAEVWQGDALREARKVLDRSATPLPASVREFLDAGTALQQRVRTRRRQAYTVAFGLLAGVAVVAVLVALGFASKERVARQRWAEAQREGARASLVRGDLLEARAKLRSSLEKEDSPLARALWWDVARRPLVWQKDLGAYLYDGAISPDGTLIAAASLDRSVYLIDPATRRTLRKLRGHEGQVYSVAFSPDGNVLAAVTRGGHLSLWDPHGGVLLKKLPAHEQRAGELAFHPEGTLLAAGNVDGGSIPIWDVESGALTQVLEGHELRVNTVDFHPDGRHLASASDDGTVGLWDLETGAIEARLDAHPMGAMTVGYGPDGRWLVTGGQDSLVRVWDAQTREPVHSLEGHDGSVLAVAFSPDGRRFATGSNDQTIRVWDTDSGRPVTRFEGHGARVNSVSFGPDGTLLVSSSADETVRLWSVEYRPQREHVPGHHKWIMDAEIAPDGRSFASSSADRQILLWDLETGAVQKALRGHTAEVSSVAFSPDGTRLASGSWDQTVRIWDVRSGTLIRTIVEPVAWVRDVDFSPDGRWVVSVGQEGEMWLWDAEDGGAVRALGPHRTTLLGVDYHPDGRWIATAGQDQVVRLWDPQTGEQVRALEGHTAPVWGVAWHPGGQLLASGAMDYTARLWDLASGDERVLAGHEGPVYHLGFHPGGHLLGTPSADHTARIWNLDDGTFVELTGHRAEVNCVRFGPDGARALTVSDDATIRLWDGHTGRPVWRAPLMLSDPPRIVTHRGWIELDRGTTLADPGKARWMTAVEQQARLASAAPGDTHVCLQDHDGDLELWDLGTDELLLSQRAPRLEQLLAIGAGCVSLADGEVQIHTREGTLVELPAGGHSISPDGDGVLVASGRRVYAFDAAGRERGDHAADVGVTAMLRTEQGLALGFKEGDVQLVPTGEAAAPAPPPFEDVPSSAVVRLIEGPMDTVVVGYANGLVGIWDLRRGTSLYRERLHGPVAHLLLRDHRLYAATELGDHHVVDLGVFYDDYCEVMREVWESVPVVWEEGLPIAAEPDPDHPCMR